MSGNVSLIDGHIDEPKKTNYDRIRNMSVEEMANVISVLGDMFKNEVMVGTTDPIKIKQWLESEVEGE